MGRYVYQIEESTFDTRHYVVTTDVPLKDIEGDIIELICHVDITKDGDTFQEDKRVVYQRGSRKGQLKMKKQWLDAIPLLYSIEKWRKYETMRDFWVK